jgi:hypothetical protein
MKTLNQKITKMRKENGIIKKLKLKKLRNKETSKKVKKDIILTNLLNKKLSKKDIINLQAGIELAFNIGSNTDEIFNILSSMDKKTLEIYEYIKDSYKNKHKKYLFDKTNKEISEDLNMSLYVIRKSLDILHEHKIIYKIVVNNNCRIINLLK